jgi:hypothetical protein
LDGGHQLGRYAELFTYNDNTETYSLENPIA